MKTTKITLADIKNHDWDMVAQELELSEEKRKKYIEYGEFASTEIEIDENLNIVGGKILKLYENN